jgi:hypothetical protein
MTRFLIFAMLALAWTFVAYADLTDGLVLYMPLDEDKGDTAQDLSENGFGGKFNGNPKWAEGKFGRALQFSASSDFVSIPDHKALQISGEITQAAWIKLDRLPSAHAIIFGTRNDGAPGRKIGFGYGMNPSNNIKVWTNNPAGGFLDVNDVQTKLQTNQWYYLAYTHTTADSGLVEIYVDGKVTHSQKSNNPVDPSGAPNPVTIGTWAGEAWPGSVDEVRLWNRALSPDEIQQSMNAGPDDLLSVDSKGKLATSWGKVKRAH